MKKSGVQSSVKFFAERVGRGVMSIGNGWRKNERWFVPVIAIQRYALKND